MALAMSNVTEGISESGLEALYKEINTIVVKEAKKEIEDHKDLDKALEEMWSGDDRKVFIKNLDSLGKQINDKLQEYDKAIKKEFDDLEADWKNFQKNNVVAR